MSIFILYPAINSQGTTVLDVAGFCAQRDLALDFTRSFPTINTLGNVGFCPQADLAANFNRTTPP